MPHCRLAHDQIVHQDAQVLFWDATLQSVRPKPVMVYGVIPPLVQNFMFRFVELHDIPVGPFFQPVEVPLNGCRPSSHP